MKATKTFTRPRIRRWLHRTLSSMVLGALLVPALVAPFAAGQAQAQFSDQNPFEPGAPAAPIGDPPQSDPDIPPLVPIEEIDNRRSAEQKTELQQINSVPEAMREFGIEGNTFKDRNLNYVYRGDFRARSNTSREFLKFEGNPFLVWSNKDHEVGDTQLKFGGIPVRFVLSEVMTRTSDITGVGHSKGVVWIFRNEYNRNLAIILWSRKGNELNAGDIDRFVYAGTCQGTVRENEDTIIAEVPNGDRGQFPNQTEDIPNDPESDETEKKIKEYNLTANACHKTTGAFSDAIEKALESIKEAISAVLDWIKSALLNVINIGTLTDNRGLTNAWKTMRDFVNIIFILVMVTIAFSNILRIDTDRYGIRALLPRLIFGVIAVNFSFILVQILTNVAYIISQPFASKAFDLLANPPATGSIIDPSEGIGQFIIALLLVLMILFGFIILFAFFVLRMLIIWFLAALSPFVFLFMVLPLTRGLAGQWWQNALKWIFAAPIAFVLLFIAAELIGTAGRGNEDINGPDFLLKVAFFLLAAVAAVMIPLQLGGQVVGQAYRGVKSAGRGAGKAGKYGGKGAGAALAGTVGRVSPGGTSLATRARATGYGLGLKKPKSYAEGSRGDLRQKAAMAHLEEQTGRGKGVGKLTGATPGQRTIAQQRAIGRYQKEMATVTPAGKRRIAWAHGNPSLKAGDEVFDSGNNSLGRLTADEADFAGKRQASEAAFAELSQAGLATHDLTETYAGSGLQQLNVSDPAQAAVDRNGEYRQGTADAKVQFASPDDMKKWDHSTYLQAAVDYAEGRETSDYHRTAAESLGSLDKTRAAYAVTQGHRNSMPQDQQRELMRRFAGAGGFHDANANRSVLDSHNNPNATIH
ncbi:MAG: hypothetical protein WD603_00290 [Patescibacteria group bacterium]